jgi:NitT/TauT family transport system substrate-binding protein
MALPGFLARIARRCRTLPAALVLALTAGGAGAQTSIKLSLDAPIEGPTAFFLVPLDKGYFSNAGLDVAIGDPAGNGLDSVARIAGGGFEVGFADVNALIRYRGQHPDAPVKAVFMVYNRPPFAVVGRKSRGVTDPKSLEGKRLGVPPASASRDQWPIFAKLNNIDLSKVTLEPVGTPVRAPMLAAGQLDATLGYAYRIYVDIKDRGVPADDLVLMQMADYGLKLYGSAIMVNSTFAAAQPGAVKAFLSAFVHGLRDAIADPAAAVDLALQHDDLAQRDVELARLRMAIDRNVLTPEVRTNGLGAIDAARMAAAIDQIGLTFAFKTKPKVDDVFDPAFLPAAEARKAPAP